jgi:hypothetical protein
MPAPPEGFAVEESPTQILQPPAGFVLDRDSAEIALRLSAKRAAPITPDHQAEILTLSRRTGLPTSIVQRNYDDIRKKAEITATDYQRMLRESPKTAGFLTNSDNAAVTKDDHPALTAIESIFNVPRAFVGGAAYGIGAGLEGAGRLLDIGARSLIPPWMAQPQPGEQGPIGEFLTQWGQEWQQRAREHAPPAAQQNAATELAGGLGQLVPALAASIVGAPELAVGMFSGMGAQSAYDRARAKGLPPGGLSEDLAMIANAGVYGFTGEFGMGAILKKIPPSLQGSFLGWLTDKAVAGGTQGLAMALQGAISNVITKVAIDHDQKITEGLLHDLTLGGAVGATARILLGMAAPSIPPDARKAMEALASKSQLEELSAQLKESKTQERSQPTMSEFIDHVTDGDKRYISPKAIVEYATKANLDPAEVADALIVNGREKLADALPTGQDIAVPLADYTRIANTDHEAFFNQYSRRDPEAANAIEAQQIISAAAPAPTPEEVAQQETIQSTIEQADSPEVKAAIDAAFQAEPTPAPEAPAGEVAQPETFIDRIEREAKARIQARGVRLTGGIDPFMVADYVIIGTAKVARGVRNFAEWSREMLQENGPQIRPYLRSLYAKSVAEAMTRLNLPPEAVREAAASVVIDQAVDQAAQEAAAVPMITDPARVGWTPEQAAQYEAAIAKASLEQRERIQEDYRKSFARSMTDAFEAKRVETEKAVGQELNADREQAAIAYFRKETLPNGDPLPEGVTVERLDQALIEDQYGKFADSAEMQTLRKIDAYRKEGGAPPDDVAQRLGYGSVDEMVQRIMQAPKFEDAVKAETDKRMRAQYGDVLTDGTLDQKAKDAVMIIDRAEIVEIEMKAALQAMKASGEQAARDVRAISRKDAREAAEAKIAQTPAKDLHPGIPYAAVIREAKAGIEAFAKGDMEAVFNAATRELVNLAEYKATRDAQQEVQKIYTNQRSFDKTDKRARIRKVDESYIEAIDGLRAGVDFIRVTDKELAKLPTREQFIAEQKRKGQPVDADTLDAVRNKNYREMTVGELRELNDAVEHVAELARIENKLLTEQAEQTFDETRDAIVDGIKTAVPKGDRDLRTREDAGTTRKLFEGARAFGAEMRKAASLAFELDGFENGALRKALIFTSTDAGVHEATMQSEANARLMPLLDPVRHEAKMGGKGQYFKSVGMSLNLTERMAIALYMGTATGEQRVLGGEGWTRGQVQSILDSLTATQIAAINGIHDHFETYRPETGKLERETTGNAPEWLEPQRIETENGVLKGGYYPIKYDPARSAKAEAHDAAAEAKALLEGAYTASTTRQSYLKSRVEEVHNRPLLYSFAGLYQGTNEIIHDLAWRRWLIDANRLMRDPQIHKAISERKGKEGVEVFTSWIQDNARGTQRAASQFERVVDHLRKGTTVSVLAWKTASALKQLPDLSQSAVRIGKGWVGRSVVQLMSSPIESMKIINEDPFMRDRSAHLNRDIHDIRNRMKGQSPVRRALDGTLFGLTTAAQAIVDRPTYLAQYNKSMMEHGDESLARQEARQAVLDTQGGGQVQDLAQIQRGGPIKKLFTMFYHGFSAQYQILAERTQQTRRVLQSDAALGKKAVAPLSLAVDYAFMVGTQAAVGAMIAKWFHREDEVSWANALMREGLDSIVGLLPGLREFTGTVEKVTGLEQYKRDYAGPAGLRIVGEMERLGTQIKQGEWDRALERSLITTISILAHLPGGEINQALDAFIAMREGRSTNPLDVLSGVPRQ